MSYYVRKVIYAVDSEPKKKFWLMVSMVLKPASHWYPYCFLTFLTVFFPPLPELQFFTWVKTDIKLKLKTVNTLHLVSCKFCCFISSHNHENNLWPKYWNKKKLQFQMCDILVVGANEQNFHEWKPAEVEDQPNVKFGFLLFSKLRKMRIKPENYFPLRKVYVKII